MTWRSYMKAAFGLGLVAAALTTTTVGPAVAQGVLKPVQAFIVNTSADPVPVSVVSAPQVLPQLWPGVPISLGRIVFNDLGGIQKCVEAFEAPPNQAVLLRTLSGWFSVPPGAPGRADIRFTNLDGSGSSVTVPMQRTAGIPQPNGLYDQYSGSLDMNGYPVTRAESCVIGPDSTLSLTYLGFTVDVPQL